VLFFPDKFPSPQKQKRPRSFRESEAIFSLGYACCDSIQTTEAERLDLSLHLDEVI
jgi:hypothetical protein